MHLHHTVLNDSIMRYHEVPQRLFCKLFDTSELSVGTEALPQLWYVPVVKLKRGIPCSHTNIAVERKLNGWAHVGPVLLVVMNQCS